MGFEKVTRPGRPCLQAQYSNPTKRFPRLVVSSWLKSGGALILETHGCLPESSTGSKLRISNQVEAQDLSPKKSKSFWLAIRTPMVHHKIAKEPPEVV